MIVDINKAIVRKLLSLYPDITIYDEKVPQQFETPSFFISTYDQDYNKRINDKYNSTVNYDISYFPNTDYKNNEMYKVRTILLRELRELEDFRAINIKSNITDEVLHIMFDVKYSEIKSKDEIKMQNIKVNENLKE